MVRLVRLSRVIEVPRGRELLGYLAGGFDALACFGSAFDLVLILFSNFSDLIETEGDSLGRDFSLEDHAF